MKPAGSDGGGERRLRTTVVAVPSDGDDACIAEARHVAAAFLGRARAEGGVAVSARAVDVTQLVVSELVTNARRYAPGPLWMELRIADDVVEVTVQDGSRVQPVAHLTDPGRVGRHGLEIVVAVAQAFRVRLEPSGKRVTATVALGHGSADGTRRAGSPPPGPR
ncbi:ATP-binding protein [Streptomyces sp. NPDC057616]|uniref:ATP-binding protein n=1 Tax=Streptomyces sp. NPDC057616 TaxID=3346183 RepID=UPI0036AFD477